MVHYDTMMQTHLRQVADQQGTECIKMFHVCGSHCGQKSQIGGYNFNMRGNEGHENLDGDLSLRSGAQRWPEGLFISVGPARQHINFFIGQRVEHREKRQVRFPT